MHKLSSTMVILASAAVAHAASISGQVQDAGGTGIAGLVYLYAPSDKGWDIQQIITTPAGGSYTFSGLGTPLHYKIFVRPNTGTDLADRWYDYWAPYSGGWIGEDADELALDNPGSTLTGINVQLPVQGGIDGHVRNSGGSYLAGMWVRAEWRTDFRLHHNDQTKGSPQSGLYSMRGLPADSYLFLVYDPNGHYETRVFPGPYTVTSGNDLSNGDFVLYALPVDPWEPNNTATQASSNVDASVLYQLPPQPFLTAGALVGPLNADIDWYCFQAAAGDHFLLTTDTNLTVNGQTREHPWIDPVVGWWSNGGASLSAWADDSPGSLNPQLEVWVTSSGKHCAVVTTYGDTGWVGAGQTSAGMYTLRIDMMNRRPHLATSVDGAPTPLPPASLVRGEGQVIDIVLDYSDADADPLTVAVTHTDALGALVSDGVLVAGAQSGTYTWTISNNAADADPYTLVFTVSDGEFEALATVVIDVTAGNVPPPVPVPMSPVNGEVLSVATTALAVSTAEDEDNQLYDVQFEVLYGDTVGPAVESGTVPAVLLGETTFDTAAIPENTVVFWRARGNDGQLESAYSAWSAWQSFRVDVENDPPPAPEVWKPGDGELALSRRPTLAALTVADPDGDPVTYVYEVASDEAFTSVLATSPSIAETGGPLSAWRVTTDLDWDTEYYARVSASDDRGGEAGFGLASTFRIKPNVLPAEPEFLDPDPLDCGALVFDTAPPTAVELLPVVDPEGDAVTLEVEVVDLNASEAAPYASGASAQGAATSVEVALSGSGLPEDAPLTFRARAIESQGETDWALCPFWMNLENGYPGASVVSSPSDAERVPVESKSFTVRVQLGADPEVAGGVPGAWTTLAYCITEGATPSCPIDPRDWPRLDPSEIVEGAGDIRVEPAAVGQIFSLRVCTMDETLACGPPVAAAFHTVEASSGVPRGCGCGSLGDASGGLVFLVLGRLVQGLRRRGRST